MGAQHIFPLNVVRAYHLEHEIVILCTIAFLMFFPNLREWEMTCPRTVTSDDHPIPITNTSTTTSHIGKRELQ